MADHVAHLFNFLLGVSGALFVGYVIGRAAGVAEGRSEEIRRQLRTRTATNGEPHDDVPALPGQLPRQRGDGRG